MRGVLSRHSHARHDLGYVVDALGCFSYAAANFVGGYRLFFHRRGDAVGDVVDLVDNGPDLLDRLDGAAEPVDLRERGIDEPQAADLRRRLAQFAEDWDRPEMAAYDELPPR